MGRGSQANFDKAARCYNLPMLPELHLDDILRLRKRHPCGGYEWKVVRLGADIGLECTTCQRRMLLPRRKLARSLKAVVQSATGATDKVAD